MIDISADDERINYAAPQAVKHTRGDVRLNRFPQHVTEHLHGQIGPLANTRSSSGCYLSFQTDSPWIVLKLARLRHHQMTPSGVDCEVQQRDGRWVTLYSADIRCYSGDTEIRFASGLERGKGLNTVRIYLPLISTCAVAGIRLTKDSILEPAEIPPVRWLAIGDSLTQGFSVQAPSQHWVHQVSHKLDLPVWNLGVGGLGIDAQVFEWALQAQHWDLVTIGLGSNQAWSREATAQTGEATQAMLDAVAQASSTRVVWLMPPWKPLCAGLGPPEYMGVPLNAAAAERLEDVCSQITERCAENNIASINGLLPENHRLFVDGLHPAALGMQHYTQQVYDYLKP